MAENFETIGIKFETNLEQFRREAQQAEATASKLEDSLSNASRKVAQGGRDVEGGAQKMGRAFASMREEAGRAVGHIDAIASSARSFALIGAGMVGIASIPAFASKLVAVQRQFDVLNSSLVTVTGSSAAAQKEFAWIKQFAAETPFGLAQAVDGFVKMKALGLDPTRASLTSFGNTASAMGKSLNQMIEAVADASTGEFERLKEFGIKAKKDGNEVKLTFQGVTTTVRNSAQEITKYLEEIGNNQFAGAMEERAKTLDGAIAELGDTWDDLFRTISSQNAGGFIHDTVRLAISAIQDLTAIVDAYNKKLDESSVKSQSFAAIQNALGTAFEAVAVVAGNVAYVVEQIVAEVTGLASQAKAILSLDWSKAVEIGAQMRKDAEAARADRDARDAAILGARAAAAAAAADRAAYQKTLGMLPMDGDFGNPYAQATKAGEAIETAAGKLKEAAKYIAPYDGNYRITSGVGQRVHPVTGKVSFHSGTDVAMPIGTSLKAMADAIVVAVQRADVGKGGRQVVLKFADGNTASYLHMDKVAAGLKAGDRVAAGQSIGTSGNSGVGTGAHLHLTLRNAAGEALKFTDLVGKEVKATYSEVKSLANDRLLQLKSETEMLGTKTEVEREAVKIAQGAYGEITEAQKQSILNAAKEKDARDALIKQAQEREKQERQYAEAIQQSTAAMQQQLAVEAQRYAADLAGMGKGQQWRDRAAAEQQINDRYQTERNKIADDLRRGQIGQGQYDEWLAKIDETNRVALEMDRGYYQQKSILQADWATGATEAMNNYADTVANVAQSTEQMFTNAFKGMEDALVQFVTTGKLDFKSLADSIIADMVRIAIQQSITGPLAKWAGGLFSGTAGGDIFFGNALGGVYNSPGLSAYSGQIVSKPTLFPFAKGTGLMGEAGPEAILPLKRGPGGYLGVRADGGGGGGGDTTVNIVINTDGSRRSNSSGPKEEQMGQLGKMVEGAVMSILHREQRPGGVLA